MYALCYLASTPGARAETLSSWLFMRCSRRRLLLAFEFDILMHVLQIDLYT